RQRTGRTARGWRGCEGQQTDSNQAGKGRTEDTLAQEMYGGFHDVIGRRPSAKAGHFGRNSRIVASTGNSAQQHEQMSITHCGIRAVGLCAELCLRLDDLLTML